MSERYEFIRGNRAKYVERDEKILKRLNDELDAAIANKDEDEIEELKVKINEELFTYMIHQSMYLDMREVIPEDFDERLYMLKEFSKEVSHTIPDGIPIVFHGNKYIRLVEEIIKTGGLFSPEERGVGYRTFATQIDVGAKKNIQTPIEFGEPSLDSYMPYGAIFAFMPEEDEYDKVLTTGMSSEVRDGVKSVDFRKNPERLVAIISTTENQERLKKVCSENGIDPNKVVTPKEFLERCKERYRGQERG